MPNLLSTAFVTGLIIAFMDMPRPSHGKYRAPEANVWGTLFYTIVMMLLSLPTTIITYRYVGIVTRLRSCSPTYFLSSITTPIKLPWLNPVKAFRVLLTPTERSRPWILYLTPGLLAAEVSHIAIVVLGLGSLRRLLLPSKTEDFFSEVSYFKLGIYLIFLSLATAIIAPLEVILTRLAIQRNHSSSEYNSVSQEIVGDSEEPNEFAGTDEDVIGSVYLEFYRSSILNTCFRQIEERGGPVCRSPRLRQENS